MHPDAPYFIILLFPNTRDFTRQGKSADTQWVKPNNQLSGNAPWSMHPDQCTLMRPTLSF